MLPIKCVDAILPLWGSLSLAMLLAAALGGSAALATRGVGAFPVALGGGSGPERRHVDAGTGGCSRSAGASCPAAVLGLHMASEGLVFNWFRQIAVLNAYSWFVRRVQKWHQPRWECESRSPKKAEPSKHEAADIFYEHHRSRGTDQGLPHLPQGTGLWGAIKGLAKRQYDETRAADGVIFRIEEGEFVGFLGPNGAGKTTVLKMLSGPAVPDLGPGQRARVRAVGTQERDEAAVLAAHGPEERALVGLARARIARTQPRDLRHRAEAFPRDRRRTDRAARRGRQDERHGARTLAGRAHEDGTHRRAAAPARRCCFSTSRPSAWT